MPEPITGELRGLLADINWTEIIDHMQTSAGAIVDGGWLDAWHEAASNACDAIDALHSNLECENDELERENAAIKASVAHAYASGYEYAEQDRDGWVELPKDADGVPWHIGDVTENGQTVSAMGLNKHGWHFVGTVNDIDPAIHRHYHAPTVEDVLREFADIVRKERVELATIGENTIAEYAKRLRLAGSDAE